MNGTMKASSKMILFWSRIGLAKTLIDVIFSTDLVCSLYKNPLVLFKSF